jgi:hypothetical protein
MMMMMVMMVMTMRLDMEMKMKRRGERVFRIPTYSLFSPSTSEQSNEQPTCKYR